MKYHLSDTIIHRFTTNGIFGWIRGGLAGYSTYALLGFSWGLLLEIIWIILISFYLGEIVYLKWPKLSKKVRFWWDLTVRWYQKENTQSKVNKQALLSPINPLFHRILLLLIIMEKGKEECRKKCFSIIPSCSLPTQNHIILCFPE